MRAPVSHPRPLLFPDTGHQGFWAPRLEAVANAAHLALGIRRPWSSPHSIWGSKRVGTSPCVGWSSPHWITGLVRVGTLRLGCPPPGSDVSRPTLFPSRFSAPYRDWRGQAAMPPRAGATGRAAPGRGNRVAATGSAVLGGAGGPLRWRPSNGRSEDVNDGHDAAVPPCRRAARPRDAGVPRARATLACRGPPRSFAICRAGSFPACISVRGKLRG